MLQNSNGLTGGKYVRNRWKKSAYFLQMLGTTRIQYITKFYIWVKYRLLSRFFLAKFGWLLKNAAQFSASYIFFG